MHNDELINSPETLGFLPRYVLQHHAISRSAHKLSATAQKLTIMAMALLPTDLSSLTASFTFTQFCKALNIPEGGNTYVIYRKAISECVSCLISIEVGSDKKGNKKWKEFTWFSLAEIDDATGKAEMTFSVSLAKYLSAIRWVYSKINLTDIGELQSKYALKIFQMATSYSSLEGKKGNRDDSWFFERSISELYFILGIPEGKYKQTYEFRRNAIDLPIKEINEANLGFTIKSFPIKQGRSITGFRFECEEVPVPLKNVTNKTEGTSVKPRALEDKTTKWTERDKKRLIRAYPDEFEALLEEGRTLYSDKSYITEELIIYLSESYAFEILKERHGLKR